MLSTMTTSENFPLANQTGCPRSPYKGVIQPSFVNTILRHNPQMVAGDGRRAMNCRLLQNSDVDGGKMAPTICYYPADGKREELSFFGSPEEVANSTGREENDFSKSDLESELIELLEQLDVDDATIYEQSKPLKIDPEVLKLDFSKLPVRRDCGGLDNLWWSDFSEVRRASHHLSGGGLLSDASQDDFQNSGADSSRNRFCKLSGGGLISTENVFNFEDLSALNFCGNGVSNFLNQISPSSPLTFDLTTGNEQEKNVTSGISSEPESTNPFKNSMRGALEEENCFSPTNPFSGFCNSSSLSEIPSISCMPPKYENISLPQKSFSQCSTRPASPVLKVPEECLVSNPFLINDTSPEPQSPPPPPAIPQFLVNEPRFQNPGPGLAGSSSFIFAVPIFPIFQHNITNSSTQTGDLVEGSTKTQQPVYQNVTNQVEKFVKRNDHSEYDLQCLKATVKDLRNSGWYYENVSWQESVVLLTDTEPGTFLIRDSSDPNFLFSLSVQTSRGPTSVRLHYVNGQFRLDAEKKLIPHMPSFNSVIELIDYYVENTVKNKSSTRVSRSAKKPGKHKLQKSKDQVWIDSQGNIYSNILLVRPLYKRDHFSSLQHLTRLTINRCIKKRLNAKVNFKFRVTPVYESSPFQDSSSFQNNFDNFCPILSIDALPLPSKLHEFLREYPYCH